MVLLIQCSSKSIYNSRLNVHYKYCMKAFSRLCLFVILRACMVEVLQCKYLYRLLCNFSFFAKHVVLSKRRCLVAWLLYLTLWEVFQIFNTKMYRVLFITDKILHISFPIVFLRTWGF